jgi:hypothetical protein
LDGGGGRVLIREREGSRGSGSSTRSHHVVASVSPLLQLQATFAAFTIDSDPVAFASGILEAGGSILYVVTKTDTINAHFRSGLGTLDGFLAKVISPQGADFSRTE